jgi:diaminopimelate epimerase
MTNRAYAESGPLLLTKHHGLGNDFLVALLPDPPAELNALVARGPELARNLCDRRRGIGADGLILAPLGPRAGTNATMILFNADGSRAEMSGNGIRCLGQALAMHLGCAGGVAELVIETDAGTRHLQLQPGDDPRSLNIRVGMGPVTAGPHWQPSPEATRALAELQGTDLIRPPVSAPDNHDPFPQPAHAAVTASIGNPHLVVLVSDPWAVDVARLGPLLEADFPAGINVEFIAPRPAGQPVAQGTFGVGSGSTDALDLAVWERGAGVTGACGTGATAAATVAHRWGLVGPRVAVYMPGGTVEVIVDAEESLLCGPSTFVARIEVDLA